RGHSLSKGGFRRRTRAEPGDAGGIPLLARYRGRRGRDVYGARGNRWRSRRLAQPRHLRHHRPVLARRARPREAGRHSGDGGPGREETARARAPHRGGAEVKKPTLSSDGEGGGAGRGTWLVLAFALVFPSIMGWLEYGFGSAKSTEDQPA